MTFDLNTLLTGNSSGGNWYNGSCGNTSQATPFVISGSTVTIPDGTTNGVYNFNYAFAATASCAASCVTVMLNVASNPNAGTGVNSTMMQGDNTPFDLTSLLTGEDTGGTWATNSGLNTSNPTFMDLSSLSVGTYDFTYSVTNTCGSDSTTVQIEITVTCPTSGTFNTGADNQVCVV